MSAPIVKALKPVLNELVKPEQSKQKAVPQKKKTPKVGSASKQANVPVSVKPPKKKFVDKLETIVQYGDPGVLQATTQVYDAEPQALMEAIDCVINRLSMTTSIFVFPGGVHPSYIGLYLQMAFLTYVKMCGELTGSFAGTVPVNLNDWAIPLPFAKFLQGYGKYYEDGCSFRTAFNHDTELSITYGEWGPGGNKTLFDSRTSYPSNNVTYDMVPDNFEQTGSERSPEWMPTSHTLAAPIVETDFSVSVLRLASEAISTCGMAYVMGNLIPHVAPCASAYTQPSATLDSLVIYFDGIADYFHPEVALMYTRYNPVVSPNASNAATFPRAYSKRCICMGMDEATNGAPPWFLQTLYNMVFILSTYKKYPRGPLSRLKWCTVPLETLYPVPVKMHFNGIADLVNYHFYEVISQWNYTISSKYPDPTGEKWFSYVAATYMTFLAHLYRHVPYHRVMITFPEVAGYNKGLLQSLYASPGWLSTKLPPLISNCISDIGVVAYRGRVYYPDFYVFENPAPTDKTNINRGPLWTFFQGIPNSAAPINVNTDFFQFNLIYQGVVSTEPYFISPNPFGIEYSALYATFQSSDIPVFTINGYANLILQRFYAFHDSISTNQALNKSMIHMHNDECGSSSVMLSSFSGTPYTTQGLNTAEGDLSLQLFLPISSWPDPPSPNSYPLLYTTIRSIAQMGSLKQITSDDMVRTLIYFLTWDFTNFGFSANDGVVEADSKFGLRLQPSVSSIKLMQDIIRETFSSNSAFGEALAARLASYKYEMADGVISIPKRVEDTHCFIGKLFDAVLGGIGNSLRLGVGQVSGMACAAGATMLGVPELSPLAGKGCTVVADKLLGAISSSIGIAANDTNSSNRTGNIRNKSAVGVSVDNLHQQVQSAQAKKKLPPGVKKRKVKRGLAKKV